MRPTALTTAGPIVRLGTKWPSMTSRWMAPAPPFSTERTASSRRAKLAERMEGQSMNSDGGLAMILRLAANGQADGIPLPQREARRRVLLNHRAAGSVAGRDLSADVGDPQACPAEQAS